MAGFGNQMAPDLDPSDLKDEHNNTRFDRDDSHAYSGGHDTYGSGATAGAGFGNKSAPDPEAYKDPDMKFDSHDNTDPYTGRREHGSGSVGGAGYGNKTGSFKESHDSTLGKIMEKAGHVMHNENLEEKGRAKRVEKGFGQTEE